jgi:phenylpropionate dioxygenase-like ring-hydroxylating dioxygenase large terminal subunit
MPAYPRGWYCVCDSDDLAPGDVKALQLLGQELVAARSLDGDANVFDAFCPHLGAHLGHGGTVTQDGLRCPFHHWAFDLRDGRCTKVPYANRIPAAAGLGVWHTQERNGLLMVWVDPEGKPPMFEVDTVPELDDPRYVKAAELEWTMHTHCHEVLENVFDTAHLRYVHGSSSVPEVRNIEESPGRIEFEIRGTDGDANSDLDITLWGMGVQRLLYKIQLPVFELDTLVPVDEETVYAKTRLYMQDLGDPAANESVAAEIAQELDRQVQADNIIFQHKRHVAEPILCDGDGPIPIFRRFAQQFYA